MASIEAAAFERALRKGAESERALRWQDAADLYADLSRKTQGDPRHALALLRYGNALMELRRWDDARAAIDDALREAKAAGDGLVMAQAQLRRAIRDEDRWREDLAEAVVFFDREGMKEKAAKLRALLGRKVV